MGNCLEGVSRLTILRLAKELGIPFQECDLQLSEIYNASEAFLTSTSLCLCPIKNVDDHLIGKQGQLWGPISERLRDAYTKLVGVDFVAQYLNAGKQSG